MDFPFENLGPERFQEFCQALLTTVYPGLQCLPVRQPDGGRDALFYVRDDAKKAIAFQVKYAERPLQDKEPHVWLRSWLESESPKLEKLVWKGISQYVLLTNVPGTAHLDVGSIDKVQELLSGLPVPAICWWRSEISRHLELFPRLRFAYPELFLVGDLLALLASSGAFGDAERRNNAILAYVKGQFVADAQVRFKQVDLQNSLRDLFVDVPLAPKDGAAQRGAYLRALLHDSPAGEVTLRVDRYYPFLWGEPDESFGAARFLLTAAGGARLVLEGAPGQGKSTLLQYVCQVHRARILGQEEAFDLAFRPAPIRLPLRVDLRDLAGWVSTPSEAPAGSTSTVRSLEVFLAAAVAAGAGGDLFTVGDLRSVLKVTPALLALDGLDEVAEVEARAAVVKCATDGIERLRATSLDLQVVVTSRPPAFANSPGFAADEFQYYQLQPLPMPAIESYARKWCRSKSLASDESTEIQSILQDRLQQPHMSDLARNPMQLAILLQLIHQHGESLPTKRSALYDAYMRLFLDRESTKSSVVKKHRELLENIHGYLAWVLHSEAESASGSGRATHEEVHAMVGDYLKMTGHKLDLVEVLFHGAERVYALVSRLEGTLEFEVQPIREYFAARFLYETAPRSPAGREAAGSLPQRFDALAQSFYWLNVARFFCGRFGIAELSMLADRLRSCAQQEPLRFTSHPWNFAATLVSDLVFSQYPNALKAVTTMLLDPKGLDLLLLSRVGVADQPLELPPGEGRDELVAHCFAVLDQPTDRRRASSLIDTVRANRDLSTVEVWRGYFSRSEGENRIRWLQHGHELDFLNELSEAEALAAVGARGDLDIPAINALLQSKHAGAILARDDVAHAVVADMLDLPGFWTRGALTSPLSAASALLSARAHHVSRSVGEAESVALGLEAFTAVPVASHPDYGIGWAEPLQRCVEFLDETKQITQMSRRSWDNHLVPWVELVECARRIWGPRWSVLTLAAYAARSTRRLSPADSELADPDVSLVERFVEARLRSGDVTWWETQHRRLQDGHDQNIFLLACVNFADGIVIDRFATELTDFLQRAPVDAEALLVPGVDAGDKTGFQQSPQVLDSQPTIAMMVGRRVPSKERVKLALDYVSDPSQVDFGVTSWAAEQIAEAGPKSAAQWRVLAEVARVIQAVSPETSPWLSQSTTSRRRLPFQLAVSVTEHSTEYPASLVEAAEARVREQVGSNAVPVLDRASAERWFSHFENDRGKQQGPPTDDLDHEPTS